VLPDRTEFWVTMNVNFLDQAALEWCKLLSDKRGQHYWGNIVTDSAQFTRPAGNE
jgi:hypothetical protein